MNFKNIALLLLSLLLVASTGIAQTVIAGWTFPTGTSTDANPDMGLAVNSGMSISTQGGTSTVNFNKFGATTYSAQATGWDGGANLKCWQIEINTSGYQNLKLNSKQTSGGNNPGPRDFKAQYKVDSSGTWTDISNTILINANNWTSAMLDSVDIPAACDNQPSVFIRWIMTSDTSSAPSALVTSMGVSKIDDIIITGTQQTIGFPELESTHRIDIFPNPCHHEFFIQHSYPCALSAYNIYSPDGVMLISGAIPAGENITGINTSGLPKGVYFLLVSNDEMKEVKKIIVE